MSDDTDARTEYGYWSNVSERLTVEGTVRAALGPDTAGSSFNIGAIADAYRDAINEAFGDTGVTLNGNNFYGPCDEHGNHTADVDLREIVDSVEFWPIAERVIESTPAPEK